MDEKAILYYMIKLEGGEEYEVKFEDLTPEERNIYANAKKEWHVGEKIYSEKEYREILANANGTPKDVVQKKILELRDNEQKENQIKLEPFKFKA